MTGSSDPFDELASLIQEARKPFPVTLVRRLIRRATSHVTVTPELAHVVHQLNAGIKALAEATDEIGGGAYHQRREALGALTRLQAVCRLATPH